MSLSIPISSYQDYLDYLQFLTASEASDERTPEEKDDAIGGHPSEHDWSYELTQDPTPDSSIWGGDC